MRRSLVYISVLALATTSCGDSGSTEPPAPVAASVSIIAGNGQSARASEPFTQQLVVQVGDASGRGVSGVRVTFEVSSGSATVNPASAVTDAQGQARTAVSAGSTAGTVLIAARAHGVAVPATFSLTVSPLAVAISVVSGNTQSAAPLQVFAQPLVVRVNDSAGNGVSGVAVTFDAAGAAVTLNPGSTVTDAQGQARTSVTAGATAGTATVTARAAGLTATAAFSLTIQAQVQVPGIWEGTTSESLPIHLRINAQRALDSLAVRLTFPTLTSSCNVSVASPINNSTITTSTFDFRYALNAVTDLRLTGSFSGSSLTGTIQVIAASSGLYACGSQFFGGSPNQVLVTRTYTATRR